MKKTDQSVSIKQPKSRISSTTERILNSQFIVEDIPHNLSGKGIVLIYEDDLKRFNLKDKDYIEVIGNRKTYAQISKKTNELILDKGIKLPNDKFPKIQMDFSVRKNCEVKIGETVKIRRVTNRIRAAKLVVLLADNAEYKTYTNDFKSFKKSMMGRVLKKGDEIWMPSTLPKKDSIYTPPTNPADVYFTVFFCNPKGRDVPVVIDSETVIKVKKSPVNYDLILTEDVYLDEVGGMKKAKDSLMEIAGIAVNESEFVNRTGIDFTNCVLLSGPSGCGKTLLAKAIVNEFPVSYFIVNGPEVAGEKPSEAPEELKKIFEDAKYASPSIIIIDQVEALATNREDLRFDSVMRNIVTQFSHLLETISKTNNVFVIATTNKPESIDSTFMTQSRFGKEIKIGPPKKEERIEILKIMAKTKDIVDEENVDFNLIAENTYGFSGGDLNLLFQSAFIEKLRRIGLYERFVKSKLSYTLLRDKVSLTTEDFMYVLNNRLVKPTILRTYSIENPKISFEQVGGLKEAKRILKENIQYPQLYPEIYKHYNLTGFKGLLLYGPPGCGKTLLVKALASESNMNFISIKGAEILNHWLGESEAAVREIFSKAKESAPCIVFFDELDAVATRRGVEGNVHSDRVTAQILTELDGIEEIKNVICIGATNRLDIIDPAIMRPGRLYPLVEIALPNEEDRKEILNIYLKNKPVAPDVKVDDIVAKTDGFNGAELEKICSQAAMNAIRKYIDAKEKGAKIELPLITMTEFNEAIKELHDKLKPNIKSNLYL